MRIGLFLKYDREVVKWSENREIPDLWGRVDRYALRDSERGGYDCSIILVMVYLMIEKISNISFEKR